MIEPGSAEWVKARIGCWTASRMPELMSGVVRRIYHVPGGKSATTAKDAAALAGMSASTLSKRIKDGVPGFSLTTIDEPGAAAVEYVREVAVERLTGRAFDHFVSAAMRRGLELEPEALEAYAFAKDVVLSKPGLVFHPTIPNVGATPDGGIEPDGLVDAKCPDNVVKHLLALTEPENDRAPGQEYRWQGMCQLWCMPERKWCDLSSYQPDFPPDLQIAVARITRNEEAFSAMATRVAWAEREVEKIMAQLRSKGK